MDFSIDGSGSGGYSYDPTTTPGYGQTTGGTNGNVNGQPITSGSGGTTGTSGGTYDPSDMVTGYAAIQKDPNAIVNLQSASAAFYADPAYSAETKAYIKQKLETLGVYGGQYGHSAAVAAAYDKLRPELVGFLANPTTIPGYVAPTPANPVTPPATAPVTPEPTLQQPKPDRPLLPQTPKMGSDWKGNYSGLGGLLAGLLPRPQHPSGFEPVSAPDFSQNTLAMGASPEAYKPQQAANLMSWQPTAIPQIKAQSTDYLKEYGITKGLMSSAPQQGQQAPSGGMLTGSPAIGETKEQKQAKLDQAAYLPDNNRYLKDYKLGWQAYA